MTMHGGSETTLEDRIVNDDDISRFIEDAMDTLRPMLVDGASPTQARSALEKLVFLSVCEWTGE